MLNTTNGPVPKDPQLHPAHTLNTSRVVEEDMQHLDEEPEILAVLAATGWCASVNGEAVPLVAFVALDDATMYGVAVAGDGRIRLTDNVEDTRDFRGYTQTNELQKEQ
jgi:hypothetical protein